MDVQEIDSSQWRQTTEPLAADHALTITSLTKRFATTVAVDALSLTVPRGSFFGLVGPNGAGKTTALSMAVGLLRPDAGTARIFGHDVWADPVRAKELVGVLPDGLSLPERLTGRELLTYTARLRGLDRVTVAERADELLRVLELTEAERTMVIDYSAGMRKKIGLATALMHAPKLLVLDEPLEAVDPVSASTIRTILQRFVAAGGSVVLSSHVMALVEPLCDHVAVITRGQVVAAGPLADVRGGAASKTRSSTSWAGTSVAGGPVVVGVLISMKLRVLRNSLRGAAAASFVIGGIVGLGVAVACVLFTAVHPGGITVGTDIASAFFAVWTLGWLLGPILTGGGDETLRPENFALLPIRRHHPFRADSAASRGRLPPAARR